MPSEKRRQRQRVRHEAGDFVPSTNEDSNKSGNESVTKNVSSENSAQSSNENSHSNSTSENICTTNSSPVVVSNSHFQEKEKRNFSQRKSNEASGNNKQGKGSSFRGKREIERQPQKAAVRQVETNVAFQEEREYEPVMIMESKPKKYEEIAPSLPEPAKYRRSEVISNWLQYDDLPPEENIEDGEDYLMGEDFSHVLNLSVNKSSGGFLHLKGEMSWGNVDQSHLENHGLGALKVADLIASLETIPLYEQLKIPADSLPIFAVSCMKSAAEKNRSSYKPDQEYVTDIEINETILEKLKINENEPIKLNAEEPKSLKTNNTLDATYKFSMAFKPEPTDVDLDKFGLEGTPDLTQENNIGIESSDGGTAEVPSLIVEAENKSKEKGLKLNTSAGVESSKTAKNEESKISNTKAESIKSPPNKQDSTPQFDFGLTKTDKFSKKTDQDKKHNQKQKIIPDNESRQPEEPPVDLNKPLNVGKQAPVLVKESEVENLEDWLDSVLDD